MAGGNAPESASGSKISSIGWIAFAVLLLGLPLAMLRDSQPRTRLIPAVCTTFGFAVLARILRGVTLGGAAAGFLVTLILFVAFGGAMFDAVLLVFVLTYLATRFGRSRKRSLEIAERPGGRDAAQVLANLGFAALAAACAQLTPWHLRFLAGSIAALAEAASDTASSEMGKAVAHSARLIISGRIVPAGTDGGLSLPGTLAGIVAAGLVGIEAFATGMLSFRMAIMALVAGVMGTFLDSLLGATLERFGWLTNNGVNLVSTGFAVLTAILLATFL
jgi:uncharacterized protein (TIGR00297 family)